MIYLNGGFSAIESPFRDGGGATIDRSTVQMVIAELESQRVVLETERQRLLAERMAPGKEQTENARLEALTQELAQTRAKIEYMERRARLSRESAGPLSPAEIQKELEKEIAAKSLIRTQYEQLQEELQLYRENLRKTDANFAALQEQHATVLRELEARRNELEVRGKTLEATRQQLGTTQNEAARLGERLTAREADLTAARTALNNAETSVSDYRQRLGTAEADLAFLQGRSSAMEKELASTRDRIDSMQKNIKARDIELSATKTRLENMQNVLKNAVSDLSRARSDLAGENAKREEAQTALAQLKGDYTAVTAKLQNAEEKLRSDVLTRYTQAAVKLKQHVRESRFILDRNESGDLFLPAVKIGPKNYLISALRTLAAARENISAFGGVTELNYQVSRPDAGEKGDISRIGGPLLGEKSDCRVALLEVPEALAKPLTILTRDELKQRGIQDLYLFKAGSFGKDSTILDSRCSMSFESDDDYLYIRNGARVSSELKADIGDLVLTKQGELVGVVVALEEYDFGRQLEARCFVFGRQPDPASLPTIELTKPAGQDTYRDFSDKVNFWLDQARPLDARKRRR
ncbi:Chromosome partition protein Smc [bioreactor metagenome]|uniref:Chromosome partition protein Smc n=1 Tax=bioreactor metagenome TaxID=1076179 RepID=A0A644ZMQ2_9ZZZZ